MASNSKKRKIESQKTKINSFFTVLNVNASTSKSAPQHETSENVTELAKTANSATAPPVTISLADQSAPVEPGSPEPSNESSQSAIGMSQTQTESSASGYNWTADESKQLITELFGTKTVHSIYQCSESYCNVISKTEIERLHPKKFNHSLLNRKNWWLVFVEGEGMYCIICKKHMMKHQNNREVFSGTPSVRFKHDAVKTHCDSNLHIAAVNSDQLQKSSCFHQEFLKKADVEYTHIEKAFSVAYFLMKEFIANRKFQPLLNFIQSVSGDETLKYFRHQSKGSHQEIFQALGDTIKTSIIQNVNKSLAFGLLTDEVSDIAVHENLVTFVQFYSSDAKKVETKFLSCRNILENFESANANAIKSVLDKDLEHMNGSKLTGFSSDGASVMTGKINGVAALLRHDHPSMVNIHCVCHRLALSCSDSNDKLSYIKTVELLLRQLWQLFENSPKKMAVYLKVQMRLKSVHVGNGQESKVSKRLKKACRTRWLSLDAAVNAVHQDFEAILQTLAQLEENDAAAHGLLKKISSMKFLGTIYILRDLLPILSDLSKHFQSDSLNFSAILPAINLCKSKLKELKETEAPLNKLAQDIDSFTEMCSEIKKNDKTSKELFSLLHQYVDSLVINIDRRFSDTSSIVAAYSLFDPTALPKMEEVDFKTYGNRQIAELADHFFSDDVKKEKLVTQWQGFKYHMHDVFLPGMPEEVKKGEARVTATEWLLLQLLRSSGLRHFNPELLFIAEAAASLPVSNAWPERGGSILKVIKTKQRNRLSGPMLESLLHVGINGPTVEDATSIIKQAVHNWLSRKPRKKLGTPTVRGAPKTTGTQTEEVAAAVVNPSREELRAAIKEILLEGELDDDCTSDCEADSDADWDTCSSL